MANGKGNVQLTSLDDLFTTQEQRDDARREKVVDIPLDEIHDFPNHPFRVVQDDAMNEMTESVKQFGVLVPAMVRPREDGGYELISGHRRKLASTLAGRDSLPCIIRELTEDEAIIVMVDSNLQREQLLPSEKAKAYKMKLEAMKRQGRRTDLTLSQVETKLRTSEVIAQQAGESRAQVDRFIRLNNLVPEIMSLVDEGRIGMTPAVELSYLKPEEQELLADTIDSEQATPSLSQAQRMRKLSNTGSLNDDSILNIMMEQKKPVTQKPQAAPPQKQDGLLIPMSTISQYFPKGYDLAKIENMIVRFFQTVAQARQKQGGDKKRSDPER